MSFVVLLLTTGRGSSFRRRWLRDRSCSRLYQEEEQMPSKRDEYFRHHQNCVDLAKAAVTAENGALWLTAATGGRFLIDREDRLAAESHEDDQRLLSLRP